MTTLLIIAGSLHVWFFIGCVVLASVDDKNQSLFKWASSAPYGLYFPTVLAWPVILWLLWLDKQSD